jgi:hypothetical protein
MHWLGLEFLSSAGCSTVQRASYRRITGAQTTNPNPEFLKTAPRHLFFTVIGSERFTVQRGRPRSTSHSVAKG